MALVRTVKNVVRVFLPDGSKRRIFAGRVKQIILGTNRHKYRKWIKKLEPHSFVNTEALLRKSKNRPLISIVVPCYNTPRRYMDELLESVRSQLYSNWELCIADGSTSEEIREYIQKLAESDARISYVKVGDNLGIVGNTNKALEIARGQFVAFMDHDDVLSPYALAEVIVTLNAFPETDLIYTDEDKLSDNGKHRSLPFFKPDWSPELLLGINYITHFVVARKKLIDELGGLRGGFDGAQDYDFLLRITELTDRIRHIPKILYHWRMAPGSTAKHASEKNYADVAGRTALSEAVGRRKIHAKVVEVKERPTNYRLQYELSIRQPKVSIIIPFKDKSELLKQCTDSIFARTTYKNYELILVSNNSKESSTEDLLKRLKADRRCKVYYWDYPFNYSKINNFGAGKASGEYLVLLNNDTEVITPGWLEELVGVASQPGIGAVGPTLHYPLKRDGIQHAGIVVGMGGMAGHVFRHHGLNDWTEFGLPAWPRNYLAVTGACLVVAKSLYDKMGGLDEVFTVAGQDVAFGIKLYEAGYRNVYWPFAALYHYESVSVGSYNTGIQLDYDHSLTYYKKYHESGDPYFNPNLDLMKEGVDLRSN